MMAQQKYKVNPSRLEISLHGIQSTYTNPASREGRENPKQSNVRTVHSQEIQGLCDRKSGLELC
jgi:hypothetical protein